MAHAPISRGSVYSTMRELSFHIHSSSSSFSGSLSGSMGNIMDDDEGQDLKAALEVYWSLPRPFTCKRHTERIEAYKALTPTWRMKERMKTVSVALVLCLNVGVDPPDVVKIFPCARQECWMDPMMYTDPLSNNNVKAVEAIGTALQHQYERWQPRARYKLSLDPTLEELKKLCLSLRRNAKDERVLFHYNGHGVPKPTKNGEIWVFNKQFTQYIPLSVVDLHHWMGTPSIYVYDCSNAGHIINYIKSNQALLIAASASSAAAASTANQQNTSLTSSSGSSTNEVSNAMAASNDKPGSDNPMNNLILLAACGANEILPMNPELPADLFTACLTTPMQIALKWFILQKTSLLVPIESLDLLDKIPGQMNDRRTMIGELNWIFTAITDTIAWNLLSKELFQKLFRQDLLVASLFRNFLLAERIMRSYNCSPVSLPRLPSTFQHPMWQAWDMTLDHCLSQLPAVKDNPNAYNHSSFFAEQLTAFQVWLSYGSERRNPPEQLPIVLQVLLSQVHRQRALELLGRFLDLGPWAVNLALSVGIFPYVLKLLQSSARDLRPLLVFIWAKLLAVDTSCQADLVKDAGHKYFLSVLSDPYMPAEHRTMAAFVLTIIVDNYPNGQEVALQGNLIAICLEQLSDDHALLRQWCALCLGKVWTKYDDARWCGVRDSAHMKLAELLTDPVPEVRASTVYALGTFVNNTTPDRNEQVNTIDHAVAVTLMPVINDASPLVRKELVVSLSHYVSQFETQFVAASVQISEEDTTREYHTVAGFVGGLSSSNDTSTLPGSGGFSSNTIKRSVSTRSLKGGVVPLATAGAAGVEGLGPIDQSASMHSQTPTGPGGSMRRVATHNSSLLAGGHGNIYSNVWRVVQQLCLDAVPGVAELAKKLSAYIRNKPLPMKSALAQVHLVQQVHHQRKLSMPVPTSVALSSSPHSAPGSPSNRPISFLAPRNSSGNKAQQQGAESVTTPESVRAGARHADTMPRIGSGSSMSARLGMRGRASGNEKLSISSNADSSSDKPAVEDHNTLSLRTDLFAWCCRYFSEPLIQNVGMALGVNRGQQQGDDVDPEGAQHQEREYRFMCAERNKRMAESERRRNRTARFEETTFSSRLVSNPACLKFHPYGNLLAVADNDVISIWDWEHGTRMNTFSNRNQRHGRITCLEFINVNDQGLLIAGSTDGLVKVYRGFVPEEGTSNVTSSASHQPTLVSAWPALSDMVPISKGSGMVLTYDATNAQLFNSGDAHHITQWDLTKELKVLDLPTGAESSITSLSLDADNSSIIVAGCGDGTVRIYDIRMSASNCNVLTYSDHKSWVVGAKTLQAHQYHVISASTLGDLHVWDKRISRSFSKIDTGATISCFDAHQYADIIACGSLLQSINIYTHQGDVLNSIKFHEGFMASKISQVACLAFHPLKMKLATGHLDQTVTVYSSTPSEGRRR